MSVSHVYFYLFGIIFTFQCSVPMNLAIITQDSERLFFIFEIQMFFHILQKRNQRSGICRLWTDCQPDNVFGINAVLEIVSRL